MVSENRTVKAHMPVHTGLVAKLIFTYAEMF